MSGSIVTDDKGTMLRFNGKVTLAELGDAAKAYSLLIQALDHREPTWDEFTNWLLREGYVEKEEKK